MPAVRRSITEAKQYLEERSIPVPFSGCWLWTLGINTHGYGQAAIDGLHLGAHRLAYIAHKGEIPEGMHVCHTCDERTCVNPDHLFLGTIGDNMRDRTAKGRTAKGRTAKGIKQHNAKLTEDQVRAIRADGRKQRDIAKAYGMSQASIWALLKGATWQHVA